MRNQLTLFDNKPIRCISHNEEIFFSITDIILILTDSPDPLKYWDLLLLREPQLTMTCIKLKMSSVDDKAFATNCANIKGLSEIVEFISSSNTQLFILWLESLDKAFIEEAESPELLTKNNESKGYANEWTQRKNYKKSF